MLAHPAVRQFSAALWGDVKQSLIRYGEQHEAGAGTGAIEQGLRSLADAVLADPEAHRQARPLADRGGRGAGRAVPRRRGQVHLGHRRRLGAAGHLAQDRAADRSGSPVRADQRDRGRGAGRSRALHAEPVLRVRRRPRGEPLARPACGSRRFRQNLPSVPDGPRDARAHSAASSGQEGTTRVHSTEAARFVVARSNRHPRPSIEAQSPLIGQGVADGARSF